MPKYVYKCNECEEHFEVYHGMSENQEGCIYCRALSPHRVPQMPFLKRSEKPEANRAILKEAKKDARNQYYDD